MEDELKTAFSDISVQLVPGHGGVFEVTLDNNLIYAKSNTGRFPDAGEVTDIINNLQTATKRGISKNRR